ncbi:hypothetical protein THAOC_28536 [Thalassiosira oceanica]|uniref:Uncharacterized protein n=1 Tax=Thalassiosira oceanica TaxID=159749 RepID=K0RIZ3_THAOC|nr:hypothetical protein THAOC_28536 [Thalassiosira oceanica]|eukprot:EJK52219.1 hypothetical protein THAOC_28536 [Thalassiosira oceanica]
MHRRSSICSISDALGTQSRAVFPESHVTHLPATDVAANRILRIRANGRVYGVFPSCATTVLRTNDTQPKLLREQDGDMEGIRLRRREADGANPRIPAVGAMVFGYFVPGES